MGTTERERKRGPYQRRMKEERDQRGGQAGRGVMKFVWDTLDFYDHCSVPISLLYPQAHYLRKKCFCRLVYTFFKHKKEIYRLHNY